MSNTEFLYRYLNNSSPTGFEAEGQKLWLEYIKPYVDTHYTDIYGTAVAIINPEAEYKVVIEAHADEIAWFVNYISPEGFIHVIRNGGSDDQLAASRKVIIHTESGKKVEGVFGWPAIHVRDKAKLKGPSLENIFIDVGASSKEEVEEMGVHVGAVITYPYELAELADKFYYGRALDNRIGGYMIAEVARKLKEEGFQAQVRAIHCQCRTRRNWITRGGNDQPQNQARCRHSHRCLPRYRLATVRQKEAGRYAGGWWPGTYLRPSRAKQPATDAA